MQDIASGISDNTAHIIYRSSRHLISVHPDIPATHIFRSVLGPGDKSGIVRCVSVIHVQPYDIQVGSLAGEIFHNPHITSAFRVGTVAAADIPEPEIL